MRPQTKSKTGNESRPGHAHASIIFRYPHRLRLNPEKIAGTFAQGNMAEQLPEAMKNQRVFSGIAIFSCRRTGIAFDGLSIYSAGPKAPSIAPGVEFVAQAVFQTRCA